MLENILDLDEEKRLSKGAVEPLGFKGLWRARRLAEYLIAHPDKLLEITQEVDQFYQESSDQSEHLFVGGHQVAILTTLNQSPHLWKKVLSAYVSPDFPDQLLQVEKDQAPVMLLSAALTPLRQNVGSCFATAPAMNVQRYHLELFIQDGLELMQTGQLKRIFNGEEYIAPLCVSWGEVELDRLYQKSNDPLILSALHGSEPNLRGHTIREVLDSQDACQKYKLLTEHAFLKAWEYTLASFCEYKVELYKWNLLAALGFDPEQSGGIGQAVYQFVSDKLDRVNQEILERQRDVETSYGQMRSAERFFKNATSYSQARMHRSEHIVGSYQFEQSLSDRDQAEVQAKNYAQFFNYLMERYRSYFEMYFQEVFDPQIIDVNPELFADSPAGFRLVYKHGRLATSQWSLIYNDREYIEALVDFFRMTENQLIADCDWSEGKKAIEALTTLIIQHVQMDGFVGSAQKRAKVMHRKAQTGATHLTPWSYLSGGSMEHLLKCYFRTERSLGKEQKIVKSPLDLLIFLIETLKGAPSRLTDTDLPLFAYSPTHAFRLMPFWKTFKQAWVSKEFTYTWVRDNWIKPAEDHYLKQRLSPNEQGMLLNALGLEGVQFQHTVSPVEFRRKVVAKVPLLAHQVDAVLVKFLPGAHPIFFADSNWPGLLFAFALNPGTLEMDLWRSDPEFKNPRLMHIWKKDLDGSSQKPWGVILSHLF